MGHSYTKEVIISRCPKTIDAMMIGGKYKDTRECEIVLKSIASTILLMCAAAVSVYLTLM